MREAGEPGGTPIIVGGVDSPPAAPATIGEQYSSRTITTGAYRIAAASIHTENNYEEECRITLLQTNPSGGTTEACLGSGVVSQNNPFALPTQRLVSGPGSVRAYVTNLDATAFTFALIIDKITEQKEVAATRRLGGWF